MQVRTTGMVIATITGITIVIGTVTTTTTGTTTTGVMATTTTVTETITTEIGTTPDMVLITDRIIGPTIRTIRTIPITPTIRRLFTDIPDTAITHDLL